MTVPYVLVIVTSTQEIGLARFASPLGVASPESEALRHLRRSRKPPEVDVRDRPDPVAILGAQLEDGAPPAEAMLPRLADGTVWRSHGPLIVVAWWATTAESLDVVLALAAELRRRSLKEPGCLGYEVLEGVAAPGALVLIERYRDAAALDAHRGARHYREFLVESILPMLTARRAVLFRPRDAG